MYYGIGTFRPKSESFYFPQPLDAASLSTKLDDVIKAQQRAESFQARMESFQARMFEELVKLKEKH